MLYAEIQMKLILRSLANGLSSFNRLMAILSAFLIFGTTMVLVYEVLTRYIFKVTNDWVIELCIFLLIAATFLSAGYTQAERGHVGIEVLDEVLSPFWNRVRRVLGDFLSLLVVAFIARNAWTYTFIANDEGWRTGSTWAPALWIPYSLMGFGLTTLALQMLVQIVEGLVKPADEQQNHLKGA